MTFWPASETPAKCAVAGHPGVTYNPMTDETFCLCGERISSGLADSVDEHLACCGGPLDRFAKPQDTQENS